jgi:hypothetical protein
LPPVCCSPARSRVGRWRGGRGSAMVGRAYGFTASVSALSGRCPRISVPDGRLLRFQRPLSEPCMRFSRTRLSTGPSLRPLSRQALAPTSGRSLVSGADSPLRDTSPADRIIQAWSGCQAFPRTELCCLGSPSGTMPGSDSLSVGSLPSRGGPLQFPDVLSLHSMSLTPGGSWRLHFPVLHRFHGLHRGLRGSAPPCPPRDDSLSGHLTTRQTSRDATDCRFACPPQEGFVSGLRRPHFGGRRRSATRRLGRYRDRTCTGKLIGAYLDAPSRDATFRADKPRCYLSRGQAAMLHCVRTNVDTTSPQLAAYKVP